MSLPFLALLPVIPIAGTLAVVVAGPGLGQYRVVSGSASEDVILLQDPFDAHVTPGESVVAVLATVGGKLVTGNLFT